MFNRLTTFCPDDWELLFFDTEFISFEKYNPLSLGFAALSEDMPSAYFELDLDRVDLSSLNADQRHYVRTIVLNQLDQPQALKMLQDQGVLAMREPMELLSGKMRDYLTDCAKRAKSKGKQLVLTSDFDGDFLVLSRFVEPAYLQGLGVKTDYINVVVRGSYRPKRAYLDRQEHLFANPDEFEPSAMIRRHHSYFDAWVMRQCYLASLLQFG